MFNAFLLACCHIQLLDFVLPIYPFKIEKSTTVHSFKSILAKTGELWGKNRFGEYPLICGFLKTSFLQNCCQKKSFSAFIFQFFSTGMVLDDRYLDFAHLL